MIFLLSGELTTFAAVRDEGRRFLHFSIALK